MILTLTKSSHCQGSVDVVLSDVYYSAHRRSSHHSSGSVVYQTLAMRLAVKYQLCILLLLASSFGLAVIAISVWYVLFEMQRLSHQFIC
jgi:hypothetical protein